MNSRTSSSASFDLVAQNENDVADNLNSQNDKIEPSNDKESTADQPEKEQKKSDQLEEMKQGEVMEEFKKQQQHNVDESAKMEEFKKQQQHNVDESAKMEEFQKQQQHNVDESAKMEEFQKQQQHNVDEPAKMEEFQKQQQRNIDESAKMEEFQKQQQHNIDESVKIEQLNTDQLQSDQKALLERRQQWSAPIDQGTSQLKGERSAKMAEEYQKEQQHNIDSLTEAQKGNDLFRIAGAIVLLIFIIYAVNQLNAQKDYRFKMNEQMNEMRLEMAESLKSVKAMVVAELENGNFSMAAHEEEKQTKLEELKLLREKIKQFELELKRMKEIDPYRIAGAIALFIFIIYAVHRLVNKFAELEKQKVSNANKFAELEEQKVSNANKFAELEEQKVSNANKFAELEEQKQSNANKFAELEEQKVSNANKFAELEEQKMSNANKFAELEEQKMSNANKFAELEEQKQSNAKKFAELEEHQKQQQQNIDALTEAQKRNGLIPQQNRWNSSMCHKDLTLKPDRLIAKKKLDADWELIPVFPLTFSSVLAEEPISKEFFGISYFEVKILKKDGEIQIGLANKEMPLDKRIEEHAGTYAYDNYGRFWGHEVAGCFHTRKGRPYIDGKPWFCVGDVVGCGVNLATRQIFYTKNGERLETAGLFVTFAADLFPCVSLYGCGSKGVKIEANFGPDFKYKF
uniref:B30.2/SPRY domain-containing protein n=1 Tax=Globodera rostochiensis TaxID=31243 RepID=A0A914GYE0_GLORO